MKKLGLILILLGLFLGLAKNLYADWRSYVWTYEYMTMFQATREFEYYLTLKLPDISESKQNSIQHQFELEYGLTDRWDLSLYQRLEQKNNQSGLEYGGFKVRTRYRFGEKGKYFLDPLIYLEYIRDDDFSNPNVLEGKLILAKDIGKVNLAYNQVLKQEAESGGKTEHEYSFGLNYRLSEYFKVALESKGNYSSNKYYLGPTISFAHGRYWLALGSAFGLNSRSDGLQVRTILGIPF